VQLIRLQKRPGIRLFLHTVNSVLTLPVKSAHVLRAQLHTGPVVRVFPKFIAF
jgi:hypothetical protein